MIEVAITEEMIENAKKLAEELGVLNNSIRGGSGNLAGFIGEECVLVALRNARRDNSYDHDLLINEETAEVKTKDRTVVPRPDYSCSVPNFNIRQNTKYYVFVSLLRQNAQYVKGYVLGYISKEEFFNKAKLCKKGEIHHSNAFLVKADCWDLEIKDLQKFAT